MTEKCKIQKCARLAAAERRGLCLNCYSAAKKKVEAGEVTWEHLAKIGLCNGEKTAFDEAFSNVMRTPTSDMKEDR